MLERIGTGQFGHVVTVPLVIEYEDVPDYFCASGLRQRVHFLWRPKLSDVRNDMVLEATEDSLELHARQGSRARFDAALAQVPDVAPVDPLDIK